MIKKNKFIIIAVILIGGFIMNELIKLMAGSIPSQKEVIKTYYKNKESIDFIASYISSYEKEKNEIFYITPDSIEIQDQHGKVERKIEFSEDFENHVKHLFNHSNIILIYDDSNDSNYIVFEAECKHSFVFNGIAISKKGDTPSWEFIKLQNSERISDGVYYFEGE